MTLEKIRQGGRMRTTIITVERWSHSGYEEMTPYDDGVYVLYDDHKAIVDSQSQKIAELTAENNGRALLLGAAGSEIERLSKRGVKKYSEDELRAAFEAQPVETVFPERNQEHIIGKVALHAWIECARFLGALEER